MGSEAGLKAKLRNDLTDAIRARDEIKSGTIRMVLTAITNEEVAGKVAKELTDAEVITVLSREAKKRREAAEAYEAAGRADKAALEKSEGEIIAGYLPQQMSESEVAALVSAAIAAAGATGPGDMGKVMGILKPQVAGKADGGMVSGLVKAALAQ
ncbi:MAG: GatB/YqeY domain-containing protein [Actinomycetes bacterium]